MEESKTEEFIDVDGSKQLNEKAQVCEPKVKRPYSRMTIPQVQIEMGNPILAGSVVNNQTIVATGQETGPSFDIPSDIDFNTEKTFSHEWQTNTY